MEASISFKSLSKKIDKKSILAGLSFGIEKHSNFSFYGPISSGKSAILKLISGLIYKDKGYLYINGKDININPVDIKFEIGYMPQKNDLYKNLNLLDNIVLYSEFYNISKEKAKNKTKILSEKLNINNYIYKKPFETNECINKIAIFIRSILHNPNIILLDQPTTGLDLYYEEILWDYISESSDKTIIFSTNKLSEVKAYSERLAYIEDFSIKYIGDCDSFLDTKYQYISNDIKKI
tara:strand:+ start:1202 stop:1909 length:708 start_codon:yes stop_codon:yes gene_type:complete